MVTPSLTLAFISGPRDGDTLHFAPGSSIRVGRFVRGNEIAIKDAGISTKHLRISSVSGNWVIQDLGSSNGTSLNSIALDPDAPVDLRHGDTIELGEYTSIVVNFETDDQEQKLPLRPRRNPSRQANKFPDPVGSIQVKPAAKRTRASHSSVSGDYVDGLDVKFDKKPSSRASKTRKVENLGSEEDLKIQRARNVACIRSSLVNSTGVGVGNLVKEAKNSEDTRRKNIEVVEKKSCLGMVDVEKEKTAEEAIEEKRSTRVTRSKKNEIVGDSYLELEMVLNRARKRCLNNKKAEKKPLKSLEDDEAGKHDLSSPTVVSNSKSVDMVEVDLGKVTLGEWFGFLEVQMLKQINHETESLIEPMPRKSQRVCEYIAEQRKVQAKAFVCVEVTKCATGIVHT